MIKKLKVILKQFLRRHQLTKKKTKKQARNQSSSPPSKAHDATPEQDEERKKHQKGDIGKNNRSGNSTRRNISGMNKLFDKKAEMINSCLVSNTPRSSTTFHNKRSTLTDRTVATGRSSRYYDITPSSLRHKNENSIKDIADIIFSIPGQVMNTTVKLPVYEYGSNILHVACRYGTRPKAIRYIFDNCRPDTQLHLLQQPDHEGNLPIHSLVSCLCHNEMPLNDGLEILELFHKIWPESVFEMNADEKLLTDIIYDCQRKKHDDSDEFKKLDQLCTNLRREMIKVWLTKQQVREMERSKDVQTGKTIFSTLVSKLYEDESNCSTSRVVSSTNAMKSHGSSVNSY